MASPPLRVYVPYVVQRCSESASKNTKILCPFSLSNQTYSSLILFLLRNIIYPDANSTKDDIYIHRLDDLMIEQPKRNLENMKKKKKLIANSASEVWSLLLSNERIAY